MKTLDEVIKANECCDHGELDSRCEDCPYSGIGACLLERELDALHYLKEYKNKQNVGAMMFALHNTNKTVCDGCWLSREMAGEGFKQIYKKYIEEENPPLTWDELKTMEGKPVWIEGDHGCIWGQKAWSLIRLDPENDDIVICISTDGGVHYEYAIGKEDYGTDWQAYRKERE